MNKQETRRRNPIGKITLVLVVLVIGLEALVIFGVFELKAQTVAKYAPWAYEPILRLVGEHPESTPRWIAVEEVEVEESIEMPLASVKGTPHVCTPLTPKKIL